MTTQEYQAYQTSVASFLARNYVKPGCHSPLTPDEPFFSRSACECCGSRFAGERETYVFAYEANGPGRLGRQDKGEDTTPGMCVTIGFTPATEDDEASWSYQTGDNSYTGGAYGHRNWAVLSLYRRSNCRELANEAASQIADLVCS